MVFEVYVWGKGKKGERLTPYVTAPIFIEERLNEELDTGKITLDLYSRERGFSPKTKILIEIYNEGETVPAKYFHFVVDHDDVETIIGVPGKFVHNIYLVEPSVVTQGMHIDNIAFTQEIKKIDMSYKTVIPTTDKIDVSNIPNINTAAVYTRGSGPYNWFHYDHNTGISVSLPFPNTDFPYTFEWTRQATEYARNSYRYIWRGLTDLGALFKKVNGIVSQNISFAMPTCVCQWYNSGASGAGWQDLFEVPVRCRVTETRYNISTDPNGNPVRTLVSGSAISKSNVFYNPVNLPGSLNNVFVNSGGRIRFTKINGGSGTFEETDDFATFTSWLRSVGTSPAIIDTTDTTHTNKNVSFATTGIGADLGQYEYQYDISCAIEPYESNSLVTYMEAQEKHSNYRTWRNWYELWIVLHKAIDWNAQLISYDTANPGNYVLSRNFIAGDTTQSSVPLPYTARPYALNAYNIFRKAMITIDPQIIDNNVERLDKYNTETSDTLSDDLSFPMIVDPLWEYRMLNASIHETIFENKNLWEILLQIGYYLHAIPYLEFAQDGTDRFVLKFLQLGGNIDDTDTAHSTKLTEIKTKNLSEMNTGTDSYITNLYSPQNEVEEWIVPTTSSDDYLISNDSAELNTTYNILEVNEFDITYGGVTKNALSYIFGKPIYELLPSQIGTYPSKSTALYYELNSNRILGLNYTPPTVNNNGKYALKYIFQLLFNIDPDNVNGATLLTDAQPVKFNEMLFHIKYKTQDSLRFTQFRQDMDEIDKHSEFEKYSHNDQWAGQEDKIVDSERLGMNLWGKLVRMGNTIIENNEYTILGNEKTVGNIIRISGEPYYVNIIEYEIHKAFLGQKVKYSKNFNEIAQIVSLQSAPRYFEISERDTISRAIRILDFIKLSAEEPQNNSPSRFIPNDRMLRLLNELLFGVVSANGTVVPNFAWVRFRADKKRKHYDSNGDEIPLDKLFPSSEVTFGAGGVIEPKPSQDHRDVIIPVLHYPSRNSLSLGWSMIDNFKAGDASDTTNTGGSKDGAYQTKISARYCDLMGRADLCEFILFNKRNWTRAQAARKPFSESSDFAPVVDTNSIIYLRSNATNDWAMAVEKDNREILSFNYQLILNHSAEFRTFPNLFGVKDNPAKLAVIDSEVSMFDESIGFTNTLLAANISFTPSLIQNGNGIRIDYTIPADVDIDRVKSVVIYYEDKFQNKYAIMARNVASFDSTKKRLPWFIYPSLN